LTLPPGFRCSHLTRIGTGRSRATRPRRTRGVRPIASRMLVIARARSNPDPEALRRPELRPRRLDLARPRRRVGVQAFEPRLRGRSENEKNQPPRRQEGGSKAIISWRLGALAVQSPGLRCWIRASRGRKGFSARV